MMLEVNNLHVYYGAIHALKGINFHVDKGEIVALIGANGAGKSTTLSTISGLLQPREGQVTFQGEDITVVPAEQTVQKGIVQVPEGRKIFAPLTVMENLEMGAYTQRNKQQFQQDLEYVFSLFPRLSERKNQLGGTFSGGEQQMLAIARALMARPRLLLLDEPSLGLAPLIVKQIFDAIKALNAQDGLTVFLVEQNAYHALRLAHRGYVMINGQITLSGTGRELLERPEVKQAYLEGGRA